MCVFILLWSAGTFVEGTGDDALGREAQPAIARALSVSRMHMTFFIWSSSVGSMSALSIV